MHQVTVLQASNLGSGNGTPVLDDRRVGWPGFFAGDERQFTSLSPDGMDRCSGAIGRPGISLNHD